MYRRLRSTAHSVGAAIARTYGRCGLSAYFMWLGELEIAMGTVPATRVASETIHQGGSHDVVPLTESERSQWELALRSLEDPSFQTPRSRKGS
jgi:hypothetical protein